jgi:predicted RNase H-like HicB family nuclease
MARADIRHSWYESRCLPIAEGGADVTTYTFKVVIEPDDDRWYAYCPALVERGGATWGATPEEALANLEAVAKMVVASLIEHGEAITEAAPSGSVEVSTEPLVAVTL